MRIARRMSMHIVFLAVLPFAFGCQTTVDFSKFQVFRYSTGPIGTEHNLAEARITRLEDGSLTFEATVYDTPAMSSLDCPNALEVYFDTDFKFRCPRTIGPRPLSSDETQRVTEMFGNLQIQTRMGDPICYLLVGYSELSWDGIPLSDNFAGCGTFFIPRTGLVDSAPIIQLVDDLLRDSE